MEDLEALVLARLGKNEAVESMAVAAETGQPQANVEGLMRSLASEEMCEMEKLESSQLLPSEEGRRTMQEGSPEMMLLKAIPEGGMQIAEAKKSHKVGMGYCMKKKWISNKNGVVSAQVNPDEVEDELVELLKKIEASKGSEQSVSSEDLKMLKKRQQVSIDKAVSYRCTKGPKWAPKREKQEAFLTKEMLDSGSWKEKKFKPINFNALGVSGNAGYLHPLLQVKMEFRKILIGMGFEEMPTNRWVESSFWNFDALFQPQQHPARDAHDTFFIKSPAEATLESVDPKLVEDVKNMHEKGDAGSIGYRYSWGIDEAKKNLLRTHTTAISSRMLYLLSQDKPFKPAKYFSIDRVFRNESIDATHLAEFHQVEGLVADYNLSLGDLIGVIKNFFSAIGIENVRFKPAYNPYTEPSMEIFGYHPDLKKWTEIGNSGMFRPEMLKPLGLPDGVRVIAWGLALERPTMIKFRVRKIKELFGHRISLERTRTSQLPLFKEHRNHETNK